MSTDTWMTEARAVAGQCWCDEETKDREMDVALAEVMAKRLATWMETAARFAQNEDFYRGLLDRIARTLGHEAFTSDDGSMQDSPVRLKLPELVEKMAASERCLHAELDAATELHERSLSIIEDALGTDRPGGTTWRAQQIANEVRALREERLQKSNCSPVTGARGA